MGMMSLMHWLVVAIILAVLLVPVARVERRGTGPGKRTVPGGPAEREVEGGGDSGDGFGG
jgi:hypothetical protein